MVYFNEFEPFAAQWLRNLYTEAIVDDRSIHAVTSADLLGYDRIHLFAGIGGWEAALQLAQWPREIRTLTASCPCFAAGTLVTCARGQVPIEDVVVGDLVLTHKGRWRRVLTTGSDFAPTMTLRGQGASFGVVTTAEHPFLSVTKPGNRTDWRPASDMAQKYWSQPSTLEHLSPPPVLSGMRGLNRYGYIVGSLNGRSVILSKDYRNGPRPSEQRVRLIRLAAHRSGTIRLHNDELFDVSNEETAYFLGYWLGNGWTTCGATISICSHREKRDLLQRVIDSSGIHFGPITDERTAIRSRAGSRKITQWLRLNFGTSASDKQVPSWAICMPEEWRRRFLAGYLAADGHMEGTTVSATTVSKRLAISLRLLVGTLGHAASVMLKNTPSSSTIEGRKVNSTGSFYRVSWCRNHRTAFFSDSFVHGLVRTSDTNKVVQRVYNLEVDDDNSFCAEGIAVHNCQPWSDAGAGEGYEDERHLWPQAMRLIERTRPAVVFGEQVASAAVVGKAGRRRGHDPAGNDPPVWLDGIQDDLEGAQYAVWATDLPAACVGAPHIRQRLWWAAVDVDWLRCYRLPNPEHGTGCAERFEDAGERAPGQPDDRPVPVDHSGGNGSRLGDASLSDEQRCRAAQRRNVPTGGSTAADRLDDAQREGSQGHAGNGHHGQQPGRIGADAAGPTAPPGFWDAFALAQCRDRRPDGTNAVRRIPLPQPGHEPVAAGIPRGVGSMLSGVLGVDAVAIAAARENRVGRLKAYGNSIVPQLGARFVRAFEQSLRNLQNTLIHSQDSP